jgi:hypothetical protein
MYVRVPVKNAKGEEVGAIAVRALARTDYTYVISVLVTEKECFSSQKMRVTAVPAEGLLLVYTGTVSAVASIFLLFLSLFPHSFS